MTHLLRHFALTALIACAPIALGCTTEVVTETEPDPTTDPVVDPSGCTSLAWAGQLEVGTGESCFTQVSDDASHALIAGPQGGYHVWVALRCRDCAGAQPVRYGVQDDSGAWMWGGSQQQEMVTLVPIGDHHQAAGLQAYMPGDSWLGPEPDYLGDTVRISVQLEIDGEMIDDDVTVVLDRVEYWDPPPCEGGPGCFG